MGAVSRAGIRARWTLPATVVACGLALIAAAPASATVKFKATKKGSVVTVSRAGNFPIPDAPSLQEFGYGALTAKVGGKLLRKARRR